MNGFWTPRRLTVLAVMTALLLVVSGCAGGGGARPTSWTGFTIVDGTMYAAHLEQVQVLDASDGSPGWAFPIDPKEGENRGLFYVAPAVDEERVIVASQVPRSGFLSQPKNVVWGLDRETGSLLWSFGGAAGQYIEGGALSEGIFVIGNSDETIYALDADSGALKWAFETGHRVWATPLIMDGTVYVGSMDRHFYALNLADGEVLWDFDAGGAFAGTPALQDDTLYIGAFNDKLYALDAQTGDARWDFDGENWFWGGPAVHSDAVYATDVNGNVYAVEAETGKEIWSRTLEAKLRAGPALAEEGSTLFINSQEGTVYALDAASGSTVWSQEAEGQVLSPAVVDGATVYEARLFGSDLPHQIIARDVENGKVLWSYPLASEEE